MSVSDDSAFHVQWLRRNTEAGVLKVGFGVPATGDDVVRSAATAIESIDLYGGGVVLINGPMTLPAGFVIAHKVLHLFKAVAVYDPKMGGYLVVAVHGSQLKVGELVNESDFGLDATSESIQ
ncbi:MAG TPA: CRISPR-associated protein Csx3 [Planctomycetaceae bacterium]|nr:CRISPR-associated protein Csx3 [Planctomycetaceae bacterium]